MLGELIPCGGGDPIPLLKQKLLVGRRSSCDISLRFPNVSSHHCEVELVNGYWHVRDLGSRNGIKVNGIRCDTKWLMPGDVLSVSRHRYEVVYDPQTDAPPPEDADPFGQSLLEKAGLARRKPEGSDSSMDVRYDVFSEESAESDVEVAPDWLEDDNDSQIGMS